MKKILVFAIVTLFSISVFAETVFEHNGVYYKKTSSTTACVIANPDGTKYSGDIVIVAVPQRGVFTTAIADSAFYYCKELTSIDLPTSISVIGKGSFYGCSSLKSLELPNITNVPYMVFGGCSALESIDISSVITIKGWAFDQCKSLKSVDLPNVETIGYAAFSHIGLESVNMPKVKTIGSYAFAGCSFTSFHIPASLDFIGEGALMDNVGLSHITIDEGNEKFIVKDDVLYNKDFTELIQYPIGQESRTVSVLNTVTTIGFGAFSACRSLETVDLQNVEVIKHFAFWNCELLESVNLPNVKSIGNDAFSFCYDLSQVTLGNKVDSIGEKAFGNTNLKTIRINTFLPPILDEDAFKNTPSNMLIQVPCGASSLYERVGGWNNFKNYEEVAPEVTVMSNDEKMGVVVLDRQTTCEDPTAEMEAVPRSGYEFVKWSDGATENPHILLVTEDVTITAEFAPIGTETFVENLDGSTINIYSNNGVLYVDGLSADYQVFDVNGRLVYTGHEAQLSLPRGVYMIAVGGEVQKVIL